MSEGIQFDVFLSHSSKDKAVVRDVAERLRTDGVKVWFDEWLLKPGDSIPAKIEEGLEHSRVLVALHAGTCVRVGLGAVFLRAYNLGNFLRQIVLPREVRHWTLTTLWEKLIKMRPRSCAIPVGGFPDGGGGGAARVFPNHSSNHRPPALPVVASG